MAVRCVVAVLFALAGCVDLAVPRAAVEPTGRITRSDSSVQLERYYARVQRQLKAQGLLRSDGGGADAPFTAETLVADFERIALFDEYNVSGGRFVPRQTPSRLRRWQQPLRIGITFGDLVPQNTRKSDRAAVARYAARLAALSRLDIRLSDTSPNVHVLFMYKDELENVSARLRQMVPRISPIVVREIENSPRNTFCVAYAFSKPGSRGAYSSAVIVIKAEHHGLMRLSCIHEEMAQALGLANDSPTARPSIFNDDEEFALLTRHDELLLKMLYDPRLRPGMTARMARPLLPIIAADALKGNS